MKVLFAVSNEEISESIVKKYQKEYKQIISYKNVYYFNAIIKELQKDKNYDRIVISEDLEAFTHTQHDQIDKFIFEKLDSISDEASNTKGNDIPIILICSDRRTKSEEMLVKIFGIGVYNAIIGSDRSVDEVCRLINRPRSKKDAKTYYKIESENVSYQSESENDVSEVEIQNILAHYKRLGKNEEKFVESFDNIAEQYNDIQLRIIAKFLPLEVRAVLEEKSEKYQQVISFHNKIGPALRKQKEKSGPSERLLTPMNKTRIKPEAVVIPDGVDLNKTKKLARKRPVDVVNEEPMQVLPGFDDDLEEIDEILEPTNEENLNEATLNVKPVEVEPVKRGRGRPRKKPLLEETEQKPKRGRGRPRKNPLPQESVENVPLVEPEKEKEESFMLPGMGNVEAEEEQMQILPGFDDEPEPEIDAFRPEPEPEESIVRTEPERNILKAEPEPEPNYYNPEPVMPVKRIEERQAEQQEVETVDISYLLKSDKKIVTFTGTSKNGTSFIVNNLAQMLSSAGVNVAILDTTRNKNSYYIYTNNEEELRGIASQSIRNLVHGVSNGILVNKNLTVYTSLPNEDSEIIQTDKILETLLQNHTLILIDTDFETPVRYFKQSQEIYLVQTLDILTIQPLTAFLRNLKDKGILNEKKLRIILNKALRIKGITDKTIIGGMAYYNDPAMSYMTELFDRTLIKYISLPFEEETYAKYLEGIIECTISLKGYSKIFMQKLKELANMVYPLTNTYLPPSAKTVRTEQSAFPQNMNNTLNQMKNNY